MPMPTRYELPTVDDFARLGSRTDHAISIYVQTSPSPEERAVSQAVAKSSFDDAVSRLKERGAHRAVIENLRGQWSQIAEDHDLWGRLSSSLALFIAPEFTEVYVLPNRLENQHQVADYFDIGQLLRAVTFPHEAYAVTLSANGWQLWHATASRRVAPVALIGDHPADAAEATHRDSVQGRQHTSKLVGDEGKKRLLDRYAQRVAEAVEYELTHGGAPRDVPVFVFAADPLLSQFEDHFSRSVMRIRGAADELGADVVDGEIRRGLDDGHVANVTARLEKIGDDVSAGLVATDLAEIARAATLGAVAELVFDFTVDVYGLVDDATGEVQRAPEGEQHLDDGTPAYDLLSRIALTVLHRGGDVVAVRDHEAKSPIWNGVAAAHLRHAIA